jgi:hypothetical protein
MSRSAPDERAGAAPVRGEPDEIDAVVGAGRHGDAGGYGRQIGERADRERRVVRYHQAGDDKLTGADEAMTQLVLTVFRASGTGLTAHALALRKQVGWVNWLSGGVPAADIETAERVIDALCRRLAEAGTPDEGS